jgi:hypothetical protein
VRVKNDHKTITYTLIDTHAIKIVVDIFSNCRRITIYLDDGLRTLARWTVARRTYARRTLARATRVRNKQ